VPDPLDRGNNRGNGEPLRGVRVLDFTRILSGPYCTLLLSDLGADVIKVERKPYGDDTRLWGPPFLDEEHGISTYYAALNRGKRSISLDLQVSEGRELLEKLISKVDVVLENFRPSTADSLGLDHPSLSALNPAIVSCSISGFGSSGPYAKFPGTEIVVEGMSGLMEVTGPADGDPVRFGIAMVDIATGLTAATRIIAALLQARSTGQGVHVGCSLYSTALAALGTLITSYSATKEEPRRWGSHHPSICPYGGFPTADGYIITGAINDAMWPKLCEALHLDDLAQRSRLATNAGRVHHRKEVEQAISDQCATRQTSYWLERLRARGLLGAPIRTVGQAVEDPVTREMGLFVELSGHPGVLSPRLDNVPAHSGVENVPRLGEHTVEVLTELLDMELSTIQELERLGILHTGRGAS
jgi:crotonobetainyl-CoA:carnitine CoA-transferase CaiB-like acyl-CoA transferase